MVEINPVRPLTPTRQRDMFVHDVNLTIEKAESGRGLSLYQKKATREFLSATVKLHIRTHGKFRTPEELDEAKEGFQTSRDNLAKLANEDSGSPGEAMRTAISAAQELLKS